MNAKARAATKPPGRAGGSPSDPPGSTGSGRSRTWLVLGAVALVVAVAVAVAVAASGGSDSKGGGSGGKGGDNAVEVAPVKVTGTALASFPETGPDKAVGSVIPALTGTSLFDGKEMTIAPTGKPMVIAFLAHWCPHCNVEVPRIVDLADAGKLTGVDVVGVATGTRTDAPNYPPSQWLKKNKWPFPAMADSDAVTAAKVYGLTGYPYLVFVGADGKVVARSEGEVSSDVLATAFKALAAGKPVSLGSAGASSAGN